MAVSRSVSVVLAARVNQFKADMAAAGKAASDAAQQTETAWNQSSSGAGKAMQTIGQYRSEIETVGGSLATFGAVVTGALGLTAKAAISWESAWTGVMKTVDGTPQQLAAIEKGLRGLARELPASHEEIAAVAEAAGQLGVKTDSVVKFTKTMINMGESTNLTAEEAATSMAQFMNIMGTSQKDVDKLGAAIVGLGNNGASTEKDILDMAMRLAGAGKQANLTEGDVLGMASAMASVGIEAEAGGTAMSMVMKKIGNAVMDGGAELDEFARVSGMSSEEFRAAWQEDAGNAINSFVVGLATAQDSGENVNATLTNLGITGIRESDALLRLSASGKILGESLKMGNDEFELGTALAAEAAKRYETAGAKIKIAGNSIKDSAITLGDTFMPMIAGAAESVADVATAIGKWPEPVQKAAGALGGIVGAAALASGGVMLLLPKLNDGIDAFNALRTKVSESNGVLGTFEGKGKGVAQAAGAAAAAITVLAAAGAISEVFSEDVIETQKLTNELTVLSGQSGITMKGLDDLIATSGSGGASIEGFGEALSNVNMNPFMKALDWMGGGFGFLDNDVRLSKEAIEAFDQSLATFASTGNMEQLNQSFAAATQSVEGYGYKAEDIIAQTPQLQSALIETATAWGLGTDNATLAKIALGEITGPAGEAAGAVGGVGSAAADASQGLQDMLDGLLSLGLATLDERESMRQYEEAIDGISESIKENGTSLDITTAKGRANQDAFDQLAESGMRVADSMIAAGASQDDVQAQLQRTYDDLIDAAGQFGITGKKAEDMAREVMGIPDNVDIQTWMSSAAKQQAIDLKEILKQLDGTTVKTFVKVEETYIRKDKNGPTYTKDRFGNIPKAQYYGGILTPMAAGGFTGAEMVKPNTWRVVGDRMDVDEAYIPLDGSRRSKDILLEAIARMPGLGMAKGGIVGKSAEAKRADEEERKLARERLQRVRELRAELRQDLRRGDLREQITGGLSGGYSAIDRLAGLGSEDALGRGSRSRASSSARRFESNLRSLYAQAERIDEKLKAAKDKAQELEGIKKSVTSSFLADRELDVGTVQQRVGGNWVSSSNLGDAARSMRVDVGAMKAFAGKLKKLVELGIPGAIVQEIAQAGVVEGSNMADSFIGASAAERKSYLGAWAEYEKYANQAGQYVTEGFYKGGANAANGVVKGLESQQKNVQSSIANLAKAIESTFRSVLGIHSPSTVMAELGGNTAEGLVQGMLAGVTDVQSAAAMLGDAAIPGSTSVDVGIGMAPVTEGDEPAADVALQDMSTTTLETLGLMQTAVSEGWAAMLATTQNAQLGMLTDTQTKQLEMLTATQLQQEAMRSTIAQKQLEARTSVGTEQETMRLIMADKGLLMKTQTGTDFEAMRSTTALKLSEMRTGANTTMETFKTDFSGHLGSLKETNRLGFHSMRDTSNAAFGAIRDGMDAEMEGAKPELGNNLNALIGVFRKFTAAVNEAFGDVGVKLKAPEPLKFATGGVMPGYTPGRDVHRFYSPTAGDLHLSGGEAIMRPEFTRLVGGERGIKEINKAAMRGDVNTLSQILHFATGGVMPSLGPIPGVNAFADSGVWRGLWSIVKANVPGAIKTSDYRGGSRTVSGNASYHSRGMAVDLAGPMGKIFNFLYGNYRNSNEIIYSPAGGRQIKNGQHYTYSGAVKRMHYNHVHWANRTVPGGAANVTGDWLDGDMLPMSHPFLDRAGVQPGSDLAKSYEAAAKKLTADIYAKHAKLLPGGIGAQLGKGIMSQVSEGLIDKARDWGKNAAFNGADFSNVANGPVKDMARQMLEAMGWADQFGDLDWLLTRESGWNPNAQNPSSTAYGLFQFLNGTWGTVGGKKTSDPRKQLEYGLKYIKQRYGDVRGARSFWERNHWYEDGTMSARSGWAVVGENGPELINLNGGEQVVSNPDTRQLLAQNRTFIPNSAPAFDQQAFTNAVASAIKSNGINPDDLAAALDGVRLTFVTDTGQFTGAVHAAVGTGYDQARSKLSKSSQKIGAR